jgi:hypothetical protein
MGSWQKVGAALRGAVELGNDDLLQPTAFGPVGLTSYDGLSVFCHGKSELRAALQLCSATMTHGSVYSVALRGWVTFRGVWRHAWLPFACI